MGIFKFIVVFALTVNSSVLLSPALAADREDYDPKAFEAAILRAEGEIAPLRDMNQYLWLYEALMPAEFQKSLPDRTKKSFKVHLQDTFAAFPRIDDIRADRLWKPNNLEIDTFRTLTGKITYVGFFKKPYRYDVVSLKSGSKILRVKVHFKNASAQDLEQLKAKFQGAEQMWNEARWLRDFEYSFKFQVATSAKDAHFSVQLKDKTRGPYDTYWARGWGAKTIAHELGHMLGLGDEYETLTGRSDCLEPSLMCSSHTGELMLHNYYFILRRLVAVK